MTAPAFSPQSSDDTPDLFAGLGLAGPPGDEVLTAATRDAIREAGFDLDAGQPVKETKTAWIFKALERRTRCHVAIKVLRNRANARHLRFFDKECRALAHLANKKAALAFVPVYHGSSAKDGIQPFLVMEWIEGQPILDATEHESFSTRLALFQELLHDAQLLHECGYVHGDYSRNNILVDKQRVRILDFGQSQPTADALPSRGTVDGPSGTPGYAPETQLAGTEKANTATEIHTLAATAFALFTRVERNTGDSPAAWKKQLADHGVPHALARIVLKGLRMPQREHDPAVYATVKQMADAVAHWRRQREFWQRVRQQTLVTAAVAGVFAILALLLWQKLEQERHGHDLRALADLRRQTADLPEDTAVTKLLAEADQLVQRREEEEARGETAAAGRTLQQALAKCQRALETSRSLRDLRPFQIAVTEAIQETAWVEESDVIRQERKTLLQTQGAIEQRLNEGQTEPARQALTSLHTAWMQLARKNVAARKAQLAQLKFDGDLRGIAAELTKHPEFGGVVSFSAGGKDAWESGDFVLAERTYGQASQSLASFLERHEPAADRAKRLAAQTQNWQQREAELTSQIQKLTTDYADLQRANTEMTKVLSRDRDITRDALAKLSAERDAVAQAREAAEAQSRQLQQQKTAAETKLATAQPLADRVPQLQAALQAEQEKLAGERARSEQLARVAEQFKTAADTAIANADAARAARDEAARELARRPRPQPSQGNVSGKSFTNSIGMTFVRIPAGEFVQGSNDDYGDEKPVKKRRLTRDYDLQTTEVTQEQYERVMKKNPSHFKGANFPVEQVSHDDAIAFLQALSALPAEKAAGRVYRLPTEAEWEYAARAGSAGKWSCSAGKWSFGDESRLADYAWYDKNSGSTTHAVGQKKANAWGLYDMHGNVWEWCQDWYDGSYYESAPVDDPFNGESGYGRILRGGGCISTTWGCRSANRDGRPPSARYDYLGFRAAF